MSFISKLKEIVSPSEYQDEVYGEENEMGEEYTAEQQLKSDAPTQQTVAAPKTVSYGSSLELKVVRPEGFESVTAIADHLLAKRTVVLNLEDTNKEAARRLLDFLSGVAYAIDGTLKKVTVSTFIITPNNVNVSGEEIREAVEDAPVEMTENQLF